MCRGLHCRTRSLVSFVTNDGTDHMCSSISNPNFLLQKPFAHGTESCLKISAFLKSFAVFIFQLQKSGRSVNSGSAVSQTLWLCTNIMSVYKHYVCVQTLWLCHKHYDCVQTLCLCTNIMTVYNHYDCVQTLWLCHKHYDCVTNIMTVYEHYDCVHTLWLCTNIMTVYKHYDCVQTLCLCTNIMTVYKHYDCV